jgi:alkanesulfonate monooxygenase
MTSTTTRPTVEMAWFSALCDDDYEFLGAPDPLLQSSIEHCRNIVLTADRYGFDNVLLPSGYQLGIDNTVFAAALAPMTKLRMLLAVRCGELVVPQLARQLATLDQAMGGRLTVNIISSDVPGETLDSGPRYRRSTEIMFALRELLDGHAVKFHGDFLDLDIDPPRVTTVSGSSPLFYFGGLSPAARECAAAGADVFLMWPDVTAKVLEVKDDMDARAAAKGRHLRYGWRSHVVVRETEDEAWAAAESLIADIPEGYQNAMDRVLSRTDSEGERRQQQIRKSSANGGDGAEELLVSPNLWAGIGKARVGVGTALVGSGENVAARLREYVDLGVDTFILSGYPHLEEAQRFGHYVMPHFVGERVDAPSSAGS